MAYLEEITNKVSKFKYAPYKVIMSGNKFVFVEGQLGILICNDALVKMKVKGGNLSIVGNNLCIKDIDKGELLIQGDIVSIGVADE